MGLFKSAVIMLTLAVSAIAGSIYFGLVHPGADEPHSAWVHGLIETTRDRAIAVRARDVAVPVLGGEAQVLNGAGNYAAMCTGCHLAPGMAATELSRGLYPAAPVLAELGAPDPARTFWAIKHGIKASGMPAWGGSMPDQYIWNMVAFLQVLPSMDADRYEALVAASGGHSHGGGESMPHDHETPEASRHERADGHDHSDHDH